MVHFPQDGRVGVLGEEEAVQQPAFPAGGRLAEQRLGDEVVEVVFDLEVVQMGPQVPQYESP